MRCVNYHGQTRCSREVVGRMYSWEGHPVPGGFYCRECADRCITEYREKLGVEWTLRPVNEYGQEVSA